LPELFIFYLRKVKIMDNEESFKPTSPKEEVEYWKEQRAHGLDRSTEYQLMDAYKNALKGKDPTKCYWVLAIGQDGIAGREEVLKARITDPQAVEFMQSNMIAAICSFLDKQGTTRKWDSRWHEQGDRVQKGHVIGDEDKKP
jgi:hypothetical protein